MGTFASCDCLATALCAGATVPAQTGGANVVNNMHGKHTQKGGE